jgi:hypothetical protein
LKIFELNFIKIYLDYQWRKLKNRYSKLLFVYIFNNILMVLYVVISQIKVSCSKEDYEKNFCQKSLENIYVIQIYGEVLEIITNVFRFFLLVLSLILIFIEFIR